MKRPIMLILLAALIAAALALPAEAHDVPEPGSTCCITVNMSYAGKPISDGTLTLYHVGAVAEDDGNYSFVKTGSFTSWDGEFGKLENTSKTAKSLAKFVKDKKLAGTTVTVKDGKATFNNGGKGLTQGLYLIVQNEEASGYTAISPFLVSVPYYDGTQYLYHVNADVKNELKKVPETTPPTTKPTQKPSHLPQTGQLWWPVPVLICAGLACIVVGLIRRRRDLDEA